MNHSKSWKIIQIIPAQVGWTAVHCQEAKNHEIVQIYNRPIVCWALVEAVGETTAVPTQVRGIEQGSNDLAVVEDLIHSGEVEGNGRERNQYFLGYNDPGAHKESEYWIKQANDRLRKEREKTADENND
ncbi:MAG: hypothetical protein ACREP8_05950 [Candidatus Binatia bacterium]